MNNFLPARSKNIYSLKAILLGCFLLMSISLSVAQTVTLADATGAAASITGGQSNVAVLGFNLTRGTAVNLTGVTVTFSAPIAGIFTNVRLFESTDATFSSGGDTNLGAMSLGSGNDYAITFTARPIASGAGTYYYVVVNVDPAILSSSSINVTCSAAQIATTDSETGSATGTTYTGANITELRADFTQNTDDGSGLGDQNSVELLDFTVLSNGSQNIKTSLVFTFSTDVTGILENWDLRVGGSDIGGTEAYNLSGGGTILTVTNFSDVDVSTSKNFQLYADIIHNATTDFTINLNPSGVTVDFGYPEAFSTISNTFDVVPLIADFTQNTDASSAIGDQNSVELLDFTVLSNGTQNIKTSLVFTFDMDVTNILENWDLRVDGSDISGGENYALSGGGTILTVTSFSDVDVSTSKNFQLYADIKHGALSAGDFTVNLQPTGVTVDLGNPEAFGTFSNTIDVTALTADFTQNGDDATAVADQNSVELLDFTVLSNVAQNIKTSLVFTFNVDVTNILENWDLRVGGTDIPGGENYALSGGGTILTVTNFSDVDVSTSKNFQLYADIRAGATSSNDFTISLANTGATVDFGYVESFTTFTNSIDIGTSQLSDITFLGGAGVTLNYKNAQGSSITNSVPGNSFRLGTFQLRDGGGSTDADTKATSITSITIRVTNPANIRKIALFNETNGQGSDDTMIAGTEQTMPTPNPTNPIDIVFTPSTPIRTLTDGGAWNFMVRVTFHPAVTDNQDMIVSIISVTGEAEYSGFAATDAGGANSTGGSNHTIIVTTSKFILSPGISPNPSPKNTNFGFTVKAVDANPYNNVDLDNVGKFDITAKDIADNPIALTGGGQKTLVAGQYVATVQIANAGSYTIDVSDDAYTDAPDNQPDYGDASGTITITSSATTITPGVTTPATICYGNTTTGLNPPSGPVPTAFFTLSNIVLLETDPTGFSGTNGSYTFSIALPSGFVFDQSVLSGVSTSGGSDITIPAAPHYSYPSSNIVQFSFNLNGTANTNSITISGLKVGATHPGTSSPAATGIQNITRSGGTATIAGVIPGTVLGTVSASQQNPAVNITVAPAQPTDPPINPNTTTFNVSGTAVKLESSTPAGSVFSGSGVTYSSPDYRFNPNALSAGLYPIVLAQTAVTGCQSYRTATFEVLVSGIANLSASYCTNDPVSGTLSVSPAYVTQIMGAGWTFDRFMYFDWAASAWLPLTNPNNTTFDPKLTVYQVSYQTFRSYGYPGLAVGFSVCNGTTYLCGSSTYVPTYQWVDLKTAPTVNFTLPSNIYTYCEDNAPLTLTGSPANGTDFLIDKFTAGSQTSSISHTTVGPDEVWSFSPAAVTGVTASNSVQVDITYQYRDPATNCVNTITKPIMVHDRPDAVPSSDITKIQPGALPPASTTIQLCQGSTSPFSFTANNPSLTTPFLSYNYRWYAGSVSPANLKGTSATFSPAVNTATANTYPFVVTRERNGCESTASNLNLSVVVVGSPVAPTPNFTDGIRQYCVGGTIDPTHLGVPGTNLKWYSTATPAIPISPIANPNEPTASELSITTASANVYSYSVSQTEPVNNCEGPRTPITVTVKALPVVSVTAYPGFDATKICTTKGDVRFVAKDLSDPGNPAPNGTWSGTGLAGALNDFPSLGEVELDPSTRAPGTYTLQYLYQNSANCSNSGSISVTILPTITTAASVNNSGVVCNGSPAILNNTSSINNGPSQTSTIASAEWTFGDGVVVASGPYATNIDPVSYPNTTGTYQNPQHIYPNTGTFQITGILTTSDGCPYTFPSSIPVTVSPLPVANFISENVCVNSVTDFTATTSIPVQTYDWNFSKNGVLNPGTANKTTNTATFTYTTTGIDNVELTVTTLAGCQDVIEKPIYSLPNYTPIITDASYLQDFTVNDGWLTGGSNSTWQLVTPTEAPAPLTGLAWDTKNDQDNENSWVISGCFDFSSSLKPVISLDTWSDVPIGVDGAVLQYNITGNIEDNVNTSDPDGDWVTVGAVGSGINWYDENGISNKPGNQTTVSTGWTGKYAQWRKSIYKLDDVKGNSKVVFRIAFASSQPRGSGFTFDNVFVGERSRAVLLESFTNSSLAPKAHNNAYHDFGDVTTGELVKIQYHTAFPGDDELNAANRQMNNSRAAFYGITESPTVRLDGEFRNGPVSSWLPDLNDDRVLTPSALKLSVSAVKDGSIVRVRTTIENTTSQPISLTNAHLFTTIVQKSMTVPTTLSDDGEFVFVAKQMLPTSAGIELPATLLPNQTLTAPTDFPELIWEGQDGDAIVVFVQKIEGNNKNVLQAYLLPTPQIPDVVTDVEDPQYAEKIQLFPNPANNELNIELPSAVTKETAIVVFDTHGKPVIQNKFSAGERKKRINTTELTGGMYIVQLSSPEGILIRKKVMVVHH